MLVEPSSSITGPHLSKETKDTIEKHLHSYNFWTLNGLMFAVESVKSVILALACVDRRIAVEDGVRLATLETDFQVISCRKVLGTSHDIGLTVFISIDSSMGTC